MTLTFPSESENEVVCIFPLIKKNARCLREDLIGNRNVCLVFGYSNIIVISVITMTQTMSQ